jgi:hypothetical protein
MAGNSDAKGLDVTLATAGIPATVRKPATVKTTKAGLAATLRKPATATAMMLAVQAC